MAHVLVQYSVPVYSGDQLLDGSVNTTILGYTNITVSIKTNVPRALATSAIYVPAGYFLCEEPQVSLEPPKTGLCRVVAVSKCLSPNALNQVLTRLSAGPAIT